ncbi:cyclic pyranopterin monophosphate synthase subunit MoaA [Fodinibius roseus]|uniref:GTP 3',8-cyclase n=1 Tax=Fodinibius roseus TaxID=1194090 RepID=A0A1M5H677_9BACT|nr:GTP 3',8-cyclase MoaA [Fodinibius roseus]SHG11521.1 cyclic pyranopterin monophosphate synthase subunit MoaA [Fodinibius roseus]
MSSDRSVIYDNHGRPITYLRLSVTDRCNLRCKYCMPASGTNFLPREALLSYEELERVITILTDLGISKIRITGGEPFVRKNLIDFITTISNNKKLEKIALTTNGTLLSPYISRLQQIGITSVNLSLDTLDSDRFESITRRNQFDRVIKTFHLLKKSSIPFKINTVVMEDENIKDIIPLAELTRYNDLSVRFIEEMPFNGEGGNGSALTWTYDKILNHLKDEYPHLETIFSGPHSTSTNYKIPNYRGKLGIIAAFSRTFCGTCNRIRIDSQGTLKTCLYDSGVLNIREILRDGASDREIRTLFKHTFKQRPKDGFEAEKRRKDKLNESMSVIGG